MSEEIWQKKLKMYEGLIERRSIRKYLSKPISDEDIEKILIAGHYAPSAANTQPWEFLAVTNLDLIGELGNIVDDTFEEMSGILDDKEAKQNIRRSKFYAAFFKDAPLVIFVVAKPYSSKSDEYYKMMGDAGAAYRANRKIANSGLQSCSAAIENMILAGWSLGIGSVWMTAPVVAREKLEAKLEVTDGEIIAVIPFGYPAEPPKEINRKPLDAVVRYYR